MTDDKPRWGARLALAAGLLIAGAAEAEPWSAGVVPVNLANPLGGRAMTGAIFYPSTAASATSAFGPYVVAAGQFAPLAPGRFPLVIVSHGSGGTRFGHHDLAAGLARQGYIVAGVSHPGDNAFDHTGTARDVVLVGRVHHLVALLDGMLTHPSFGPQIDGERIGAVGVGAGAYGVLLAAGARPDFGRFADYCKTPPGDPVVCKERQSAPPIRPGLDVVADQRIKAAALMAPALGFLFDRPGLAGVTIPLRLYRAGADEIVPKPFDATHIRDLLAAPPEYDVVDAAGHYVFLAPCAPVLAEAMPDICRDPPAVDRAAIHRRINAEIADFFARTLGRP